MLLVYRVTAGQEGIVADLLKEKTRKTSMPSVHAIIVSPRIKGYLIAEVDNEAEAKRLIVGVPHVKGLLNKAIDPLEMKDLLESKPQEISFNKGDLIEITSGPFKREKAKVVRIDKEKEAVTVELIEVVVPIPVTIKLDTVKVLPK